MKKETRARLLDVLTNIKLMAIELEEAIKEDGIPSTTIPIKKEAAVKSRLRLGVIVGHEEKSPGAKGIDIPAEYQYHKNIMVPHLMTKYGNDKRVDLRIYYRDKIGIKGALRQAEAAQCHCTVELHYNGAASSSATGCETLSSGSTKSMALARHVHPKVVKVMNNRDRGIIIRRTGRGAYNLSAGKLPAILVEPGFGSNPQDAAKLKNRAHLLGESYVEGALDWWQENKT